MMAPMKPREILLSMIPHGATGAELGVFKGDFSQKLIDVTKPSRLYLVDPWVSSPDPKKKEAWYSVAAQTDMDAIYKSVCQRFAGSNGKVQIMRKTSVEFLAGREDNSLGFVYIDGDHSFEAVRADLVLSYRKVARRGLICCDDYVLGKWWRDGVVRAVHEFLASHRVAIRFAMGSQIMMQKL
jgi:hypothetical protein